MPLVVVAVALVVVVVVVATILVALADHLEVVFKSATVVVFVLMVKSIRSSDGLVTVIL